ncbi:MAG: hypothetical protein ABIK44_00300 [candidate division WOR-3 bacterium]
MINRKVRFLTFLPSFGTIRLSFRAKSRNPLSSGEGDFSARPSGSVEMTPISFITMRCSLLFFLILFTCQRPVPAPKHFRIVGHITTTGYPHDVAVQNGRAYVADGQAGLAVFAISIPESVAFLGSIMDSLNEAWGVAVADSFAYVAYGNKELMIVDIRRPDSLKVAGVLEYPQPAYGLDIAVRDSMAYIAASSQFIAVNVADPYHPNLIFQDYYPHSCRGIALAGGYGYLVCEQLGLTCWRLDTFPPQQVGSMDTPGNARSVAVQENHAFIADGRNGLVVADISNPFRPTQVSGIGLPGYANGIALRETLAFICCRDAGMAIVNIAHPESPSLVERVQTPYAIGVCAAGQFIYLCDRDLGLVVVKQE